MRISAVRLAGELARRLASVAPPPFAVRADGAELQILHPDGWSSLMPLDWIEDRSNGRSAGELAEVVVSNALNSLQDAISESSREPWPRSSSGILRDLALYGSRCDDGEIVFWYGASEAEPVIAFPPIRLADVLQP